MILDQNTKAQCLRNKKKEIARQEDLALSIKIRDHQTRINNFFVRKFFMNAEIMEILVECNKIWKELYLDWFPKKQVKDKFKWL